MGITERKEKQKLEIRKQILDASMKLFVEEGFANVSIRKVADLIEYSPTTVYLYFKDKNEIMYNLHEICFEKLAEYNIGVENIKNPILRLHKMGENYIRFGLENPDFYDLMFVQREPMETVKEQENCEWKSGDNALQGLKNTLAEAMEMKMIAKGDVPAIAMAIWGMVHGMVSLATSNRFDKLVPADQVAPMMQQSLNWIINTIDATLDK